MITPATKRSRLPIPGNEDSESDAESEAGVRGMGAGPSGQVGAEARAGGSGLSLHSSRLEVRDPFQC